jgi:hypothetical protein
MTSDLHSDPHHDALPGQLPDPQHAPPADAQLAASFGALRASMASQQAPRGVEKELMDAFAAVHRRRRWFQWLSPAQWGLAGAAAALLLALPLVLRAPLPHLAPGPGLLQRDGGAAFIALDSLERIAGESDPRVLETDVPRSSLAALGVSVTPENAGDTVRAEMLVGADGAPLALRLSAAR